MLSSQGGLICHVSFSSEDAGKGSKGKLAVLLVNISAVPWYGLAALWITEGEERLPLAVTQSCTQVPELLCSQGLQKREES